MRRLLPLCILTLPLILISLGLLTRPAPAEPAQRDFTGKVVPLSEPLDKFGAKLDPDAAPYWLALVDGDGHVYPLIKDGGSRMFFKDRQLLNRPMRLTGRLFADTKMLQVLTVRSLVNGVLHEPYYWCDVCKIKRLEPNACDCCGAPLEFREDPVAK
jgi:hypothetical protein